MECDVNNYRDFFEEAPIGCVLYKQNGKIVMANRAFCDMVGILSDQLVNRNLLEYIPCEFRDKLLAVIEKSVISGQMESSEIPLQGSDGILDTVVSSNCYLEKTVFPQDGVKSDKRMIRSMFTNITDLKKKQKRLIHLSVHDALTGMYNRQFYDEYVSSQYAKESLPLTIVMIDIDGLKMINDSLGHVFGDEAITVVAQTLQKFAKKHYLLIRTGGDEIVVFFPHTLPQEAGGYIEKVEKNVNQYMLSGLAVSFSWGYAVRWKKEDDFVSIVSAAEDMMYRNKVIKRVDRKSEAVELILKTLFERNEEIYNHCRRVSQLAESFAKSMKLEESKVILFQKLGYLHDIGMASVSDEILNKKTELDTREKQRLKRHSEIGYRILRAVPELHEYAKNVLFHHENWDGSGYIYGIKGKKIPFASRLIHIVDSYDRMRCGVYGEVYVTRDCAIEELKKRRGVQLDPDLTDKFIYFVAQEMDLYSMK